MVHHSFTSEQENQTHMIVLCAHTSSSCTGVQCADPLNSSGQSCKQVATASVTGRVTCSVALKTLQNELLADLVTVLVTVHYVLWLCDGAYCVKK